MRKAVIGLGFGDEGKGMFVDYLAQEATLVRRFSGGHQVGHMVNHKDGHRHVFSNFGSGTLREVPTYWDKMCTIDPVSFMKEFKALRAKNVFPRIYVNELCPITTPYDKAANMEWESTSKHGTVGVGFGKTVEREEKYYSLVFMDLLYEDIFTKKLLMISQYYGIDELSLLEFYKACEEIRSCSNIYMIREEPKWWNERVIYEGSQGLMLDPTIGFFPHCTRSFLVPPKDLDHYYFLSRAYCTRHGNGPMPNEFLDYPVKVNPNEINVDGIQGKFRRSMLDVSSLEYALRRGGLDRLPSDKKTLVITCTDHLDDFCFTYGGIVKRFKDKFDFLKGISTHLNFQSIMYSDGDTSCDVHCFSAPKRRLDIW